MSAEIADNFKSVRLLRFMKTSLGQVKLACTIMTRVVMRITIQTFLTHTL
jgi:hypothetical protein